MQSTLISMLGVNEQQLKIILDKVTSYYFTYALVLPSDVFFKGVQDLISIDYLKANTTALTSTNYEKDPFVNYWHSDVMEGKECIKSISILYFKAALYTEDIRLINTLKSRLDFLYGVYNVPYEISLRFMLFCKLDMYWEKPIYSVPNTYTWAGRFLALLEDPSIKTNILSFELKSIDNSIEPCFKIVCSCCGLESLLNYNRSINNRVLCSNCLGNLVLDTQIIQEHVSKWFLKYIHKYNEMDIHTLNMDHLSEIVQVVKLLRPLKLIRFGIMRTERIGHQLMNTCQYIDKKDQSQNQHTLDIIGSDLDRGVANEYVHTLWERYFEKRNDIYYMSFAHKIVSLLSVQDEHSLLTELKSPPNNQLGPGLYRFCKSETNFFDCTPKEHSIAQQEMIRMGVPMDARFVCIHIRSSQYLKEQKWAIGKADYSYHDHRNADLENYVDAIQLLIQRGYYVIRMGHKGQSRIDVKSEKYIDYANDYSSPFMDIYLSVKCKFMISNSSGIDLIPMMIFKKTLLTDVAEITALGMGTNIYWLCKNFLKSDGVTEKIISHFELIKNGYTFTNKDLKLRSVRAVSNSSTEIVTALRLFLKSFEENVELPVTDEQKQIYALQQCQYPLPIQGYYFPPSLIKQYSVV